MYNFKGNKHNFKTIFKIPIEKQKKKCVNNQGAIKLNKTCLNNGLYPTHVKIKLRGQAVTEDDDVRAVQNNELFKEIENKTKEFGEVHNTLLNHHNELSYQVNDDLFRVFTDCKNCKNKNLIMENNIAKTLCGDISKSWSVYKPRAHMKTASFLTYVYWSDKKYHQ